MQARRDPKVFAGDRLRRLRAGRGLGQGELARAARPRNVAVVIGCEIDHAAQTVHAAGLDLQDPAAADPIGPGCRACERTECRHRAVPPSSQTLDIGTTERGVVPYRIRS